MQTFGQRLHLNNNRLYEQITPKRELIDETGSPMKSFAEVSHHALHYEHCSNVSAPYQETSLAVPIKAIVMPVTILKVRFLVSRAGLKQERECNRK